MSDTSKLPISRIDELLNKLDEINNRLINLENRKYIVEEQHNDSNWYRVWSDGWIEQGFRISSTVDKLTTHNFIKPFKDTNYTLLTTIQTSTNNFNGSQPDWIVSYSPSGFTYHCDSYAGNPWIYACGY